MIGQTVSHYRVTAELGTGGMGVVYRAEDLRLGRPVAIKFLPDNSADPQALERFHREARAASALNHRHICTIHEIDQHDGRPFIVMEVLEGQTLQRRIAQGRFTLEDLLDVSTQVAEGLEAAHAKGIVHRDIKPSNIFVTGAGEVKLLDFGLAKLTGDGHPAAAVSSAETISSPGAFVTRRGQTIGTVAYMSPEQVRGWDLDERSDIFSCGVVMYEMATGALPFPGSTTGMIFDGILNKTPPPVSLSNPAMPAELNRILDKAIEKDRELRYQSARDLRSDLARLERDSGSARSSAVASARSPVVSSSRRRWAVVAAGLGVVTLGIASAYVSRLVPVPARLQLVWQAWRSPERGDPPRAIALTTLPGAELYPSLSPDGNSVAFTWTGPSQGNPDIYVQLIGSVTPLRLTTTESSSEFGPVWSPDGLWVAFLRADRSPPPHSAPAGPAELRLIPALGGPERQLANVWLRTVVGTPGYLAWCPDSTCLVVTDSPGDDQPDALFVVSVETGGKRQLTNPRHPVLGDCNPAISPDGGSLVFRRVPAASAGELHWLPLGRDVTANGEPRRLTLSHMNAANPAWLPDGKEIIFSARGRLWRMAVNGHEPIDTPVQLPFVGEDGTMPFVSRPQSGRSTRLVYSRGFSDSNIWRLDTSAPGAPLLSLPVVSIASTRQDANPDLSPDNQRVTFASNRSGSMEIWVARPDGGDAVQLTSMDAQTTAPRWSRDGQLIAFQSNRDGQFDIYVIPAAGGRPRNLTSHPANDYVSSFSRDGQWVYFSSTRTGEPSIWKVPAQGGAAVQVTDAGFRAVEGTDGRYIYYSEAAGESALWRMPTSGGEAVKVLDGVWANAFAVIATGIYFIDRRGDETQLEYYDFDTRRFTTVTRNLGDVIPLLTASIDGRTVLLSRTDSVLQDLVLVEHFR